MVKLLIPDKTRTMEAQTVVPETPARATDTVRLVSIGLAYFLAHELAFLYPDSQRVLTAIWLAGGIGLASLLLSPRRQWLTIVAVLLVAGNAANLLSGRPVAESLGFMTANALESLACAWLIARWCGPGVRFERVREAFALIAVAVLVNAATALIGAGTASLTSTSRFWNSWFNWWVEDALGLLLITPLIMAWSDFRDLFRGLRWYRILEAALLLLAMFAAARVSFEPTGALRPFDLHPYMLIALLAWSGMRFGQRGVVLSLALLAVIAVTSKGVALGPLSLGGATPAERILAVQIYLVFVTCTGLLLAAAYAETSTAEARIRVLGDNLPQGAVYQVTLEPDGARRFLYVSAGVERLTGVPVDEILRDGSAFDGLILDEDRPGMEAAGLEALRNKTVFQTVLRMRRRDGQIRWMHLTSSPRELSDGRLVWDGIQTDVTESKQAEDDLHAANAELTAIHANAPVGLLSVGEDLSVRAVHEPSGGSSSALAEGVPGCLYALADPANCGAAARDKLGCRQCPVRLAVLDSLRNRNRHEGIEAWLPVAKPDGAKTRCFLVFTAPLQLRDSKRALVCVLDITDSKRAERDLRNSEARFRTLTGEAPIAISISRRSEVVFANPAYLAMFGFSNAAELSARPTLDLFAPHCRAEVAERALRRAEGFPVPSEYEATGLRRDGSEFPILVGVINMKFDEGPALVAFITDLTASKRSEEERAKLETQLRQAQKLESIGRLAGGVAHDFNNFLTVINGFSALLTRKLSPEDPLWSYAEQVRKAGERGAGLTRQLLAFSRQEVIRPIPVNLNATIADSEQMLLSLVGEHVELVLNLDAHLGQVLVDPVQIDQVILNLVANARDAMPRGGRLEIATRNIDENEAGESGRWVSVRVSDTGAGMDEATRQNIFDPFFTTKKAGEGTGLGLATVYGVMQQNAGWIDVTSEPGAGTSFRLCFPRIDDRAIIPVGRVNGSRSEAHGGETILLVEDQEAVRDFLRAVLEDSGYRVVEAGNGVEALSASAGHAREIQLLVTDVIMPGMNGRELAERLSLERPEMKTIFMSGYLADVIAHSGVLERDVAFLQKPVTPEALMAKVRDVLSGAPSVG